MTEDQSLVGVCVVNTQINGLQIIQKEGVHMKFIMGSKHELPLLT